MPLHSTMTARERILSTAGSGLGKSYDWLMIAKLHHQTRSPAKFTVVDTDNAIDRMLEAEFAGLNVTDGGNVTVVNSYDWVTASGTIKATSKTMGADDWLIVDLLNPTWDQVQEYFTEQVFGEDIDNYFLAARASQGKSGGSGSAFEGRTDWPVINKLYKGMMNSILQARGHVYAATVADAIQDTTEKEIKAIYGPHGIKPRGQKHTPHFFHTCLVKGMVGDSRRLITAKDRGRAYLQGAEVNNFALDYLVNVAGWSMT